MFMLWGLGGKEGFDLKSQGDLEDKGKGLSSDILSFGGIVFGSFTGVSTTVFYSLSFFPSSLTYWHIDD
jgi:hypothetical protein